MKWLELLKAIGPVIIAATVPGGVVLAPIITGAIAEAEAMKGASGDEKKAHAMKLVQAGAAGANAVAGKTVLDPAQAVETAQESIDTVIAAVNAVHPRVVAPTVP